MEFIEFLINSRKGIYVKSKDTLVRKDGKISLHRPKDKIKFRTNISKEIMIQLKRLSHQYSLPVNALIENGLRNLIRNESNSFKKLPKEKKRVQFKSTYNKELFDKVKLFAEKNALFINEVIEISIQYIDLIEFDAEDC